MKMIFPYPGAKWSLAQWIVEHLPEHDTYVEPFCGSAAVLCHKPRARVETLNDLHGDICALFRVIRDQPDDLARAIYWTPFSREEQLGAYEPAGSELEQARRFLVRTWQGNGGKEYRPTTWRFRATATGGVLAQMWAGVPEVIAECAERMRGVQIENLDALEVMRKYRHERTLLYLDPPYHWDTRTDRKYKHEVDNDFHFTLLDEANAHPGPAVISGYRCSLYDEMLADWQQVDRDTWAEGRTQRTEVL
jgi:DNA adenine methylase